MSWELIKTIDTNCPPGQILGYDQKSDAMFNCIWSSRKDRWLSIDGADAYDPIRWMPLLEPPK